MKKYKNTSKKMLKGMIDGKEFRSLPNYSCVMFDSRRALFVNAVGSRVDMSLECTFITEKSYNKIKCSHCSGLGEVVESGNDGMGQRDLFSSECPKCKGKKCKEKI